jgi:hypothetical protein
MLITEVSQSKVLVSLGLFSNLLVFLLTPVLELMARLETQKLAKNLDPKRGGDVNHPLPLARKHVERSSDGTG